MHRRILLTGPPGCGKTTVAGKVADILRNGASGFYTEEIRDAKKRRIGFRVVTLDGKRGELADKFSVHGPRVGSYRVNVESFERVALPQAGYPVLATIPLRGGGEFLEEIRRQRDVKTFIVTIENRGALPAQLAAMLLGTTESGQGGEDTAHP